MKRNKFKVFLSMLLIVLFSTNSIFANSDKEKTYLVEYIGGRDDTKAEKRLKEKGKEYVLKDVRVNEKPFEIKKNVTKDEKGEYPKEIKYWYKGKVYKLKALKENFKEEKEKREEYIEYQSRADVKQAITKDNITYSLEQVSQNIKTEDFKAPAIFTKYGIDSNEYIFNGKRVVVEDSPAWQGYENDIKDYLGINGNSYSITGGRFTSGNVLVDEAEEKYERRAEFYGRKSVPVYTAKYVYEDEKTSSKGEVTYGIKGAKKIEKTLIYEEVQKKITLKDILAYGAGILVVSLGIGYILYILAKKNKKRKEEK